MNGNDDRPIILGTAGHIDHGKTTLAQRLTGINTDRLPEERTRGISIDLGFADFTLPSGRHAALIDVPGHERFIRNMVAGVHGMDAVLLVVAADEGIMPQTREHLDILTLLGVQVGLTVITKADAVEAEWLPIVEETIAEALSGSFLEKAAMVTVDSVTGRGIPELLDQLDVLAGKVPGHSARGPAWLPIDRIFSVRGFGTVVTGTLVSGTVELDCALEIVPGLNSVRVRGLEVHNRKVRQAVAGQRVAVNLAGVDKDDLHRGQVLAEPGTAEAADVLAVKIHLLPSSPILEQRVRVHFHSGTASAIGRLYWYDREELEPGSEAFAELRLETPVAARPQDRFLIRSYSPVITLGGGSIVEIGRHHKRREEGLLRRLELLAAGNPKDLLRHVLEPWEWPVPVNEVAEQTGYAASQLESLCQADADLVFGPGGFVIWRAHLGALSQKLILYLKEYHRDHPLRIGAERERVRESLWPQWTLAQLLFLIHWTGGAELFQEWVRADGFVPSAPSPWDAECAKFYQLVDGYGMKPVAVEPLQQAVELSGDRFFDVLDYLVRTHRLVRLDEGLYISDKVFYEYKARVASALQVKNFMTTGELKDLLGVNRRFTVLFLELLDTLHITRREGEGRTLAKRG